MLLSTAEAPATSARSEIGLALESQSAPNAQLRELVSASGLPPAVAMTIFNRQLGAAACSETEWRGYTSEPGNPRYRPVSPEQLAHAIAQFARIGVHRDQN
ncbi:hypothetical protein [Pelomonas sp. KK5]|uniref:hypothetical protein n=1 Tax=Pelomonas sp. KK5 TaxID=1855730 RepID=UPI00117F421D|nr:hypothetical protein [Pelomonas sp. KK5]